MVAITGYGRTYLTLGNVDARGPINLDASTGSHRYWRFYVHGNSGLETQIELGTIQMYDIDDLANIATDRGSSGTGYTDIYTTNHTGSDAPEEAFEDDWTGGSSPLTRTGSGESGNIWWAVEFVTAKDIRKYGFKFSGNYFNRRGGPADFSLQYSDDGNVWFTRSRDADSGAVTETASSSNYTDAQFNKEFFTSDVSYLYGSPSLYAATSTGVMPAEIPGPPIVITPVDLELTNGTLNILKALTTSAVIDVPNAGVVEFTLPVLSSTGVMLAIENLATLPSLTSTGTILKGGSLAQIFPAEIENPTSTGFIDHPINYTGSSRLEYLSSTGLMSEFGNDAAELPELTATGTAESGFLMSGSVELESLTVLGSLDFASLYPLTATGVSQVGDVLSGSVTLERMSATGGFSDPAELSALTATGTMIAEQVSTGIINLSQLTLTGVIDNPTASSLSGSVQTKPATMTGLIVSENLYTVSASLQKLTLAATGVSGKITSASITLPFMTATGEIAGDVTATASITIPLLTLNAAINAEVGIASGSALVMNLNNKALTTFDAYGYNSFTEFNGVTLAASENGIFALTGDTDAGTAIAASIRLGKLDFDIQQLKTVDYAYVGYRASGDLSLTVRADDGTEYSYTLTPRETDRHSSRVRLGKGIRGRYLQFGLDNVAGSDFRLDTLELIERIRQRKIG